MLNKFYKELDYVNEILSKKATDNGVRNDLKILAKYYKYQGKPPREREQLLYEYCETKGKSWFNKVLHYKMVDCAINYSRKRENIIAHINSVKITLNEINYILGLELDELEKKILFAFIAIDKLKKEKLKIRGLETDKNKGNHYFGGSGEFSYKAMLDSLQMKLTRSFKEKGIHTTIKKFNEMGLTRTAKKSTVELLFVNDIEPDETIAIEVKDFDSIGLYYDLYLGDKKVKLCDKCGVPVKIVNNKVKYCKPCARKISQKQKNTWKKDNWNKEEK